MLLSFEAQSFFWRHLSLSLILKLLFQYKSKMFLCKQ